MALHDVVWERNFLLNAKQSCSDKHALLVDFMRILPIRPQTYVQPNWQLGLSVWIDDVT